MTAALKYVASTYDRNNNVLRDGIIHPGKRVITFSNILQHKTFPSGRDFKHTSRDWPAGDE